MEERNGGVGTGGGIGECFGNVPDDIFADPEHEILKDFLLVSPPANKQLTPDRNSLALMKHQSMQSQMPHNMDLVANMATSPSGSSSGDPMHRTTSLLASATTNAHLTSDRLHALDSSDLVPMVPPAPSCMNSLPLPGGPVNCLPPPAAPPPPLPPPPQNCMTMPANCHDMMGGYSLPPPPNHLVDPYVTPPSGYPTQSPVDALVGFTNNCAAEMNASVASSSGLAFNSEESSLGTQDEMEPEDSASVLQSHLTPSPASMSMSKRRSGSSSGSGRGRKRRPVDPSTSNNSAPTSHSSTRGRPPGSAKRKTSNQSTPSVTYQSQISPDQNGIKIRIKKSSSSGPTSNPPTTLKSKKRDKGRRRRKGRNSDDDDDDDDENSSGKRRWQVQEIPPEDEEPEPAEQSVWAMTLPEHVLEKIFSMVVNEEGCLPFLVRASHVCRLWRRVAGLPRLWHNADLTSTCIKDRFKNEHLFKWLCEHRLGTVRELNIEWLPRGPDAIGAGGWEFAGIQSVLETISECCHDLQGLNITGCKELSGDHLKYIADQMQNLNRLDLSSINPESNNTRCAVSMLSLTQMTQIMGERLTHLTLANNKIAGLPQIIQAIATHCPNLQVLDLSNMRTVSHTVAPFHIEKLQTGCQKLRILRITNSQLAPAQVSLKEQMASPGFPLLEELSVAGVNEGFSTAPLMDDDSLERILKLSHKLRLLDVRGCLRISDSSLVRIPAWDLEHLFLSGCYVTRLSGSGLELIAQKWAHSLVEIDLAWSSATMPLDQAVETLAEKAEDSPLKILNLCGSSVNLRPVQAVLTRCPRLTSLNLSSCRALPRGMKRLYAGVELAELRSSLVRPQKTEADSEKSSASTTVKNEDNTKTEPEDNDVDDDDDYDMESSTTSHDHRNYENSFAPGQQPQPPDPSSSIM